MQKSLPTLNMSFHDMSKLLKATAALQEDFKCLNCKQVYKKKWCSDEQKPCFFCKNFLPMRDTYQSILRDIDWWFLKSGEYDRTSFYPEFLDNLRLWANRFHVFPTKQDQELEKELRDVKNWTRDYWH
jgi:hypothetical protein